MTDTDDAAFAARLHIEKGTMLSAEVVTAICKAYLALLDAKKTVGFDANGSEAT